MKEFKNLKIAVAGTGARDIIGSTKKNHDNYRVLTARLVQQKYLFADRLRRS